MALLAAALGVGLASAAGGVFRQPPDRSRTITTADYPPWGPQELFAQSEMIVLARVDAVLGEFQSYGGIWAQRVSLKALRYYLDRSGTFESTLVIEQDSTPNHVEIQNPPLKPGDTVVLFLKTLLDGNGAPHVTFAPYGRYNVSPRGGATAQLPLPKGQPPIKTLAELEAWIRAQIGTQ